MTAEDILQELKQAGFKFTGNRRAIVELFVQNRDIFFTPKEVYERVRMAHPKVSVDTVYRTISLLEEQNVIEEIDTSDGPTKYRFVCKTSHHHHLVCLGCGYTTVLEECPLSLMQLDLKNFRPVKHRFEVYGYCGSCTEMTPS